jgi:hypothetical protein
MIKNLFFLLFTIGISIFVGQMLTGSRPTLPVFAILGLTFVTLSFFRPDIGLLIMLISTLLLPGLSVGNIERAGDYHVQREVFLRPEDFIVMMVFVGWWGQMVIKKAFGGEMRVVRSPLTVLIFTFIALMLISTGLGILIGTTTLTRGMFFFLKRTEYFLIFFMTYYIVEDRFQVQFYLKALLATSAVVMFVGVFELIKTGGGQVVTSTFSATGGNPLASFCLLILPFTASLAYSSRNMNMKLSSLLLFGMTLAVLLFTRSRGGYVSFVFVTLAFIVMTRAYVLIFPVVLFSLVTFVILPKAIKQEVTSVRKVVPISPESINVARFHDMNAQQIYLRFYESGLDSSWSARLGALFSTAPLFRKNPVMGGGLGSVELSFVDNQYLMDLLSLGVIGLVTFILLVFKLLKFLLRVFRESEGEDNYWLRNAALGLFCGLIGMLVHALTITNFYTIRTMVPFWFLMGVLAAGHRLITTELVTGETTE